MKVNIRKETKADMEAVYELVKTAFVAASHSDGDEQNFVNRLRKSPEFIPELCLVAEINNHIVGQIMFSKVMIDSQDKKVIALAPLAVALEFQNQGIGGQLVQEGHRIAHNLGYHLVILVGHEHYYPRFGYTRAKQWGLQLAFAVPDEVFMVKELTKGQLGLIQGQVTFSPAFDPT